MGAEGLIHVQLKLYVLFIAFAKIPELEGSISLSSLYGSEVNQGNLERRSVQDLPQGVRELPLRPTASEVA